MANSLIRHSQSAKYLGKCFGGGGQISQQNIGTPPSTKTGLAMPLLFMILHVIELRHTYILTVLFSATLDSLK